MIYFDSIFEEVLLYLIAFVASTAFLLRIAVGILLNIFRGRRRAATVTAGWAGCHHGPGRAGGLRVGRALAGPRPVTEAGLTRSGFKFPGDSACPGYSVLRLSDHDSRR